MVFVNLKKNALETISLCKSTADIEAARINLLGKNGIITQELKKLGSLSIEERKHQGNILNEIKTEIQEELNKLKTTLEEKELEAKLVLEAIDLTIPSKPMPKGRIHPISQTIEEVINIFSQMGFKHVEGSDIEEDWYNFTALNIDENHPARQDQDTFYLKGKDKENKRLVLRTHTSPSQVRTMMQEKPPIRIISTGRTYRADSDQTHSPMFHQIEGLVIDETSNMGNLKYVITKFLETFFGKSNLPLRFRPSYFPFTEPSVEVDVRYLREKGRIIIGEGNQWLEILGSGMVNPIVLENCGIDSTKYQGFAFGMGIERITMLKYGIADLRQFFESDNRWLNHYGFSPFMIPNIVNGID